MLLRILLLLLFLFLKSHQQVQRTGGREQEERLSSLHGRAPESRKGFVAVVLVVVVVVVFIFCRCCCCCLWTQPRFFWKDFWML